MKTDSIDSQKNPVHEYQTLIRERHLDTLGHVNNAQYMVLFEEARWEMVTSRGYGLEQVMQHQMGTVVLECTLKFMRELKLREAITIRTYLKSSATEKIFLVAQDLMNENGKLAATAALTMGCFDLKQRKLIVPDLIWKQAVFGV